MDLKNCKVLVNERDYIKAMGFFESKGYWFSEQFLEVAKESSKIFFLLGPEKNRIFLCGERNCENCDRNKRGYFPKCKSLKTVFFDLRESREEKLKRLLK